MLSVPTKSTEFLGRNRDGLLLETHFVVKSPRECINAIGFVIPADRSSLTCFSPLTTKSQCGVDTPLKTCQC